MEDALKQKQETGAAPGEAVAHALRAVRRLVVARKAEAVCAALLVLMAANLFASLSRKSITNDEIVHIPAGYYHLVGGEFQLNNEHPPLIKMWAALPLLFVQPDEPPAPQTADENFMERTWGFHERFWAANRARFAAVTFWPRAMMIPLTLALGALIFVFARKLFGETAALIAVGLYVLEPTVLAHGRIVHTDVPAALVYLLFFFTLHYYNNGWGPKRTAVTGSAGVSPASSNSSIQDPFQSVNQEKKKSGRAARSPSNHGPNSHDPSLKRALLLGLVCAVALLTKFSMLVILPVLAVYLVVRLVSGWRDSRRSQFILHTVLIAIVVLFLVNAAYYFQHPALEASDVRWVEMKSPALLGAITTGIRLLSHLVPTYYLFGVYNIELHNHFGHATSLLGQYNDLGWWYYFPVAFALKTTIPFLLLAGAALAWAIWRLTVRRDARFVWLLVPVGVYLLISLTSHINIGIRHFLPVYPFLFIGSGALLAQLLRSQKTVGVVLLVVLFGWMTFEAARTFPDYTPYMNQLASGHPHWYYLSDSNVEWGDDVGALAAYLKARGQTKVRAALSGGWSTLGRYGVDYLDMVSLPPDQEPETRYVAIGASFLNGSLIPGDENVVGRRSFERTKLFARYRDRKPEAVFGNSIYLYRERE
jgi:4-amino-4-deoxy-L-arabinose transferase-like glycosyltransferase